MLRTLSLVALACALVAPSCYQLPKAKGWGVQTYAGGLAQKNPTDIAVGPVLVLQEGGEIPEWALRRAFQSGLVKRRYSPLALEVVDENVVEASYRAGQLREDALLEILVHAWDDRNWETRTVLTFDVEARLLDPQALGSDPLWAGRLEKRIELPHERELISTERELMQEACNRIAADVLAALPARTVAPGRPRP